MSELPKPFQSIRAEFPQVAAAYDALGAAASAAGPLDEKTRELVKLALSIGARLEGATHSHTRRALALGATPAEIKHTVLLAATTLGFPAVVSAYTWVNDVLEGKDK